ncbi:hypothetical protein ACLQ3C_14730 [Gordonia sp. DT30]|uniref:hypothetical protein n=1 Tax=unclassified Gordonia (in: high G+C Gram-positive bacteria) TaxID=2657482 RepID=UPI003CF203E3
MYGSSGFATSRRERLDDGLLDVRFLLSGNRWAYARLVLELVSGRLQRSSSYREMQVPQFSFTSDDPVVVAHDGEIGESYRAARSASPTALCRCTGRASSAGDLRAVASPAGHGVGRTCLRRPDRVAVISVEPIGMTQPHPESGCG